MNFKLWLERLDEGEMQLVQRFDKLYPKAGNMVDGRRVLSNIDNQSSISASLEDYYILPGVRDFPIYDFSGKAGYYSVSDHKRVDVLMQQIERSRSISPIIIAEEKNGPYIIEGGHRMAALVELKAVSIPALIVIDFESFLG